MAAGTTSRTRDKCSRSRPSSRHDSGGISALRPLPGAQEIGAVGLAGPALMGEVLAVASVVVVALAASVVVAGTVVVAVLAASGAVAGAGAAGALAGLGAFVAVRASVASVAAGKAGRLRTPASFMVLLGPFWQH